MNPLHPIAGGSGRACLSPIRNAGNSLLRAIRPGQRVGPVMIQVPVVPGLGIARHMGPDIGAVLAEIPMHDMGTGMRRVSAVVAGRMVTVMPAAGEGTLG